MTAHPLPASVPPPWGMAPPPGYRPEDYPASAALDGRIAWAMGLLGLIPIPGLAAFVTGLVMVVLGLVQGRKNPVAKQVGRHAAIFGATLLVAVVVFFSLIGIGFATEDPNRPADSVNPILFVALPFGLWMITLGPLVAVVMGIIGLARPISREKAARILAGS